MRRSRNTKIIATLGPASSSLEMIEKLFLHGVDVFRLNFSHGSHQDHEKNYNYIREIETKHNTSIAIMMDLQGPKLRVSTFKNGSVELKKGQTFSLVLPEIEGDENAATLPHPEIFKALLPGTSILLNDGKIKLEVTACTKTSADTKVIAGGTLSNRKGVNIPDIQLPINALTEKDTIDLKFGLKLGVDYVALSFVQCREDVEELKNLIKKKAAIVAKIEKPLALHNLNDIIEASDAIMVARGDLGVEMPPEEVPSTQKHIIQTCRKAGKPVAVATQMLESMITSPTPTRAEVSDVANAVYDGTDTVMLSAESAAGDYPLESVEMMDRIIDKVEKDPNYLTSLHNQMHLPEATTSEAITASAVRSSKTVGAKGIMCFTETGETSLRVSRQRPPVPIIGVTPNHNTARRLSFAWGVYPVVCTKVKTYQEMVTLTPEIGKDLKISKKGDSLILVAGEPIGIAGSTNMLRIVSVK